MARVAKQLEFDHIVKEIIQSGNDWSEAVQEALETFQDSNYDITSLYLYTNKLEYEEKEKVEKRCRTIEDVLQGKDSVVNLTFALQGLSQTIKCNNNNSVGTIKLTEYRKIVHNLIRILSQLCKEDDDEDNDAEGNSHGEGDDSDEENDENKILQKIIILDFLLFYLTISPTLFRRYEELLLLDEALAQDVLKLIDGTSDQPK
jgi:hypothetical protein